MSTERSDHEPETPRRRRSPLAVASVAAAVLLAGGGGAYLATSASGGDEDTAGAAADGGTPPPLALDGRTAGIAPGEPDPGGAVYRAKGDLPKAPGDTPVLRARGKVTEAEVARLAKALELPGKPESVSGAWQVGSAKDGSGPVLRVNKQAPGTWSFMRHSPAGGDNCPQDKACKDQGTSVAPGAEGEAVSERKAKDTAAPVLKALGQDDAKLDASQLMGAVRVVNAQPKLDGLPTYGWSTGIKVGSDGTLVGGSGQLKEPREGPAYPVLDAERTLELLNASSTGDGRVGIGGCATTEPLDKGAGKDVSTGVSSSGGKSAAQGQAGPSQDPCEPGAEQKKRDPVAVEDATFGLAVQFVEGRQALVPSWLFEVRPQGAKDSFTITHPAVDPKFLASPGPSQQGSQEPPGSGDASEPKRDARAESYSADDKKLTVHFWGGVCSDYSASAKETDDTVKVTVSEKPKTSDRVCIMIAKKLTETVTLDKPLGDRKVVDAQGTTVPQK